MSTTGSRWQPIVAQPQKGWLVFGFTARQVDYFCILGTELSQDDYGVRYLQLAKIEVVTKQE